MNSLFREFLAARRTARRPDLVSALRACGTPTEGLGVSFVEIDTHHYAPVRGGRARNHRPVLLKIGRCST